MPPLPERASSRLARRQCTADHASAPWTRAWRGCVTRCSDVVPSLTHAKRPSSLTPFRPSPSTRRCSSSCSTWPARRRRCGRVPNLGSLEVSHGVRRPPRSLPRAPPSPRSSRQRHPRRRAARGVEFRGVRVGLWPKCVCRASRSTALASPLCSPAPARQSPSRSVTPSRRCLSAAAPTCTCCSTRSAFRCAPVEATAPRSLS